MTAFEIELCNGLTMRGETVRGGPKTPLLCIPGLTRNISDFQDFAQEVAPLGRDVHMVSLRGRARSDWDPHYLNYHPEQYAADILVALDQMSIKAPVFVGTSLGGIITMLLAASSPERMTAAVINDVGPELAPEGLTRIGAYMAKRALGPAPNISSLDEAADASREANEVAFPGRDMDFWHQFALQTFRETDEGKWTPDHDPAIGRALAEVGPAPDLWPGFKALEGVPTLVVRGALSDLLSKDIVAKMTDAVPSIKTVDVANVGHAPQLTEPDALAAIRAFLADLP